MNEMTFNPISHRQAQALAKLINSLRPDWDTHGIEAALGKARDIAPAPDLCLAAIKAATSGHNRTPSVIAMEGPHWRISETRPRHEEPHDGNRCSICFESKERCHSRWGDDHEFLSIAQARADAIERVDHAQHAQAARDALRGTEASDG